jgi:uncharacterized protein (DUF885 family)
MGGAERLAELAERYWQFIRFEQPLLAFVAGQLDDETVLFRESLDDHARRIGKAATLRQELAAIDPAGLSPIDRATHHLLSGELDDIANFAAVDAHLRPFLLPAGPDFNTVYYANAARVADARSAELHVARLAGFPAFLADVRALLAAGHAKGIRYPKVVLAASAKATRGIASMSPAQSPWHQPFVRSGLLGTPGIDAIATRGLRLIEDELIPALHHYADFLDGALARDARDSISCTDAPDGERNYQLLVRHFTSSDLSAAEIHDLGRAEVARIEVEIAAVADAAGFAGDLAGYRRFLQTDPQFLAPNADTLRAQVESLCKRIDARIPLFFKRLPRITYGVDTVPAAASAALPAAYALPAPSGGATPGMLYLNGLPERCPSYLHPVLAVHEAWPGHLMHIGLMAELDHLPAFRRHGAVRYTACVEGWALYCEHLGTELGVYQTHHHHYGRLEMELFRAARLVVDTGIHLHGWSRAQAVEYMEQRLTMDHGTIAAEVDRYAGLPGQALAYQIGGLKVRELRRRAEAALGDGFDLRDWHELVMAAGPVTLAVLEQVTDDWIAARADVPRVA